ncbi:MAG: autoinducer binding domain-containing protein [Asticcacaulis sp.]
MTQSDAFLFHLQLRRLATPAACAGLFRAAIAPQGFDTFACGELDLAHRERTAFYIIDWPDSWRDFYIRSGLIERDPLVDALAGATEPFTWSDLRRDNKFSQVGRKAIDLAAAEGWSEGLVVPVPRGRQRVGLVSLVGHGEPVTGDERAFLTLISLSLHSHVRSLVTREGFALPPAGLTPREIECIGLVAQGLSDKSHRRTPRHRRLDRPRIRRKGQGPAQGALAHPDGRHRRFARHDRYLTHRPCNTGFNPGPAGIILKNSGTVTLTRPATAPISASSLALAAHEC